MNTKLADLENRLWGAAVWVSIRNELDNLPEQPYPKELCDTKVAVVYEHVYEAYSGKGESIYAEV